MRKTRRRWRGRDDAHRAPVQASVGSGGFLRQVGQYETANGGPLSLAGIVLALGAAAILYPIARFVRFMVRR
jgi:hypothetical protein